MSDAEAAAGMDVDLTGRVVLVTGAAGQAIQCANVRFGIAEESGISAPATWP